MKLRWVDPWVPAAEYSSGLSALTVNLLVREIAEALCFEGDVLGARVVYADPDFAVVTAYGAEWILHADHAYRGHPLEPLLAQADGRGTGIELRLHGCDPDAATAAALRHGYQVLAEPHDTGHGLREAFLCDADGYVWVPDVPVRT